MNLEFSQEQHMLRDSVDRFVAQRYGFADRKTIAESATRLSPSVWQSMAEFGWLALPLPEAHGGLGGTAVDVGILMMGLGKGLVLEPVLSSSVLAAALIAGQGSAEQCAHLLPGIADGSQRAVFAHVEAGIDPYRALPQTRAIRSGSGWLLAGSKPLVLDAPGADCIIVSARIEASNNIGLFVLTPDMPGLSVQRVETLDDRLAGNLRLQDVQLAGDALLGADGDARAAINRALDHALAAQCAEAVACMQVLLDATVEYTKTRQQFGQPLSENQVLRHRMVDMAVQTEESRALALRAALVCDARQEDASARARAVSGARLKISDASRFVAQSAVQLHGAMGVTSELNIGAYFKRLLCIETSWGTRAEHMARCIAVRREAAQQAQQAQQ